MPIKYTKGDATSPTGEGLKIIVHCVNDIGAWGAGFVLAISAKWSKPEQVYKQNKENLTLGSVQFVAVTPLIMVANLVGQRGIGISKTGEPPIRYWAIRDGLKKIAEFAEDCEASIHMPRIGCGLAGGDWKKMEPIIAETCGHLDVTVYDL